MFLKALRNLARPLFAQEIAAMLAIINDLKNTAATLRTQVTNAVNLAAELKRQRDAAITENGLFAQRIAGLEGALQAAQAGGLGADDTAAIVEVTDQLHADTQALSDSNTVNSPSN
jgi:hypothetical protein